MIESLFFIAILIVSVVIHEVAHGYAAYALGDPTAKLAGRLSLNPLVHIDPVGSVVVPAILVWLGGLVFGWAKPVPYNPHQLRGGKWGPALVALAGPLSNFVVALVFGLFLRLSLASELISGPALGLVSMIILLNVMLGVFNLLPLPPLDGSKVLFALLPWRWRWLEAWTYRYQFALLIALVLVVTRFDFLGLIVQGLFRLLTGV